ncbi:MAG: cobalamin-dependent protein [Alphaproteobacteria bacterium]|nr:cobalamin-dependent protein [Alphaproteobacteria bacterium]
MGLYHSFDTKTHSSKPKIILGVAESDAHIVANHLIAIYLRDCGFDVVNLGACTPVQDFMDAYMENSSAIAIVIGSLNGHAAEDLQELESLKKKYNVNCPIILGGNLSVGSEKEKNLHSNLKKLGVDIILETPDQLLTVLRTLIDQSQIQNQEYLYA